MTGDVDGYQQLLEFFYQCPAGLISFGDDGTVDQINPAAVNLITQACRASRFDNVYECLAAPWPDLRLVVNGHPESGVIVDEHDIVGQESRQLVLGCSVVRVGRGRMMLVITDATARKEAEDHRAELLASEQQARHRLETLERNATNLAAASTAEEVADALTSELKTALGLDLTSVRVRRDGHLSLVLGPGLEDLTDVAANLAPDVNLPGIEAAESNQMIHLGTRDSVRNRYPILFDGYTELRVGSIVALPLRAADKSAIGSLVVSAADEHWFDDDELSLLSGLAGQTGLALERAQLFEDVMRAADQEHEIAVRLQRALLPDRIIDVPGVTITARVSAAADLLTVGGDWYDTFVWPSGEIAVLVGDVVGHDVEAAAKMGRLRAALAALAPEIGPSPSALLDELDRIAHSRNGVDFATAVCVVLEPGTGTVRYSSAGHPPAIVVDETGATRVLEGASSPPVGIVDHVRRSEELTTVAAGSSIVLFSDGLVERRGAPIDVGIADLRALLESSPHLGAEELADHIMDARSRFGPTDDDVITLVVQWHGDEAHGADPI